MNTFKWEARTIDGLHVLNWKFHSITLSAVFNHCYMNLLALMTVFMKLEYIATKSANINISLTNE